MSLVVPRVRAPSPADKMSPALEKMEIENISICPLVGGNFKVEVFYLKGVDRANVHKIEIFISDSALISEIKFAIANPCDSRALAVFSSIVRNIRTINIYHDQSSYIGAIEDFEGKCTIVRFANNLSSKVEREKSSADFEERKRQITEEFKKWGKKTHTPSRCFRSFQSVINFANQEGDAEELFEKIRLKDPAGRRFSTVIEGFFLKGRKTFTIQDLLDEKSFFNGYMELFAEY